MPCDEMIEQFEEIQKRGEEYLALDPENPFSKAVVSELAMRGVRAASEVRMYSREKLTVQVDMTAKDQWGNMTRTREILDLMIDELHDMAVTFLPPVDPNKPLTFEEMRKHFHPKVPKDTLGTPLPEMKRKYVEVSTIDGYHFDEVWEFVEPKPEESEEISSEVDKFIAEEVKVYEKALKEKMKGIAKKK
jgi:hypothetical protein